MDSKMVRQRLSEMDYSAQQIALVEGDLAELTPELNENLERWCVTGETADYQSGEFSIAKLMVDYEMNYVAALLTMDWIIKEPAEAKKELERETLLTVTR